MFGIQQSRHCLTYLGFQDWIHVAMMTLKTVRVAGTRRSCIQPGAATAGRRHSRGLRQRPPRRTGWQPGTHCSPWRPLSAFPHPGTCASGGPITNDRANSCYQCYRRGASADELQVVGWHISYPLTDWPGPSETQSTPGTVLSISSAPLQPV